MIKIYKNYKTEEILSRKIDDYGEYEEAVKGIIADVAKCGDEAVKKYCLKFDGFMATALKLPRPNSTRPKVRSPTTIRR